MREIERFLHRNKYKGIPNLMIYIMLGNALVYIASIMPELVGVKSFFVFDRAALMSGQVWRLISFMFVPPDTNVIFMVFFLIIYHMIGRTLEREWGTLRFNLYYLTGMLSLLAVGFIFDVQVDATYLNLALFLAFATLFPDIEFRLFFIFPVKVKWLGILDAIIQIYLVISSPGFYRLVPLMALLNYLLYFWPFWWEFFMGKSLRKPTKAIKFRAAVQTKRESQGYIHKCTICGKTDADAPGEEFRYCSVCTDYKCYCAEHLFNHEHH